METQNHFQTKIVLFSWVEFCFNYNAPHEYSFTSKEEREQAEKLMSATSHHEVQYADYKETVATSKKTYKTNKNAYIMRNQEMIDASDTDNKDYLPPKRKQSKWSVLVYQPQSGTAIAYAYAKQEKKQIINLYE